MRTITRRHVNLYLVLILLSLTSITALYEPILSLFVWDKTAIAAGQWWRILSGNFAHTNFAHCMLNLTALWLIALIFKPQGQRYLIIILCINLGVGLGLMVSDLHQYVGLSGTLHGVFIYFALRECLDGQRSSLLLVLAVALKVIWEQWQGPLPFSHSLIQAPVAIQAHLTGAIVGSMLAIAPRYITRSTR